MKKIIILGGVLILLVGGIFGYLQYHKPHLDMEKTSADYSLTAEALFDSFEQDEQVAEEKYLDKILSIKGTIREITSGEDSRNLVLETNDMLSGVICEFLDPSVLDDLEEGQTVEVKGICSGKLMDVIIVRSILVDVF